MNKPTRVTAAALVLLLASLAPASVLALPEREESKPMGMTESPPATSPAAPGEQAEQPRLTVEAPGEAQLGESITATARLVSADGSPLRGATVAFLTPGNWGEEIKDEMLLGTVKTDAAGVARLSFPARRSGAIAVIAQFSGGEGLGPKRAEAQTRVEGAVQLYTPEMPAVSVTANRVGSWVLAGVLAVVWSLYFFVARLVLRIARAGDLPALPTVGRHIDTNRRRLLDALIPMGMQAAIAPIGLGLTAVIARSPFTHTNVEEHSPGSRYDRTPYAHVAGGDEDKEPMRELPPLLPREVSFARDVLPILRANAGPHAVPPKNSPPPKGIRLDAYEHIMAREGLVVPGQPARSELVDVLVNPAMRMPPSLPPLPDGEIQLIVSWIAQGANDN